MPIAMPFVVNGGTVKLSLCESRLLQVKAVELLENEEREWDCDPKRGTFTIDVHETEYPNKMMFPSPFWLVNLDDIFWASLLIPWMQLVHRPQIPICSYRWSTIFFPVFITALVGGGGENEGFAAKLPQSGEHSVLLNHSASKKQIHGATLTQCWQTTSQEFCCGYAQMLPRRKSSWVQCTSLNFKNCWLKGCFPFRIMYTSSYDLNTMKLCPPIQ